MEDCGTNTSVYKNNKDNQDKSDYQKLPLITPFQSQSDKKEYLINKYHNNLYNSLDTSPRKLLKTEKKLINIHNLNNTKILNNDLYNDKVLNTQINVINPNKFHYCVLKKLEKNLVLDKEKNDDEKKEIRNGNVIHNSIQDQFEDYTFDQLYRKRNINKNVKNIVKNELRNAKKKFHCEDTYSISKSIDIKKPLYVSNTEKFKFISFESPFLQINKNGNIPFVLNDSEIMFGLYQKGLNNIYNLKTHHNYKYNIAKIKKNKI